MTEKKISWADIADEELDAPVVITKHGIKVKYSPPPLKTSKPIESKKNGS
jgi:hypothetical protein